MACKLVSVAITTLGSSPEIITKHKDFPDFHSPNLLNQFAEIKKFGIVAASLFPTTLQTEKEFLDFLNLACDAGIKRIPMFHLSHKMTKHVIETACAKFKINTLVIHSDKLFLPNLDENNSGNFFSQDIVKMLTSHDLCQKVCLENSGYETVAKTYTRMLPIMKKYNFSKYCLDTAHFASIRTSYDKLGPIEPMPQNLLDQSGINVTALKLAEIRLLEFFKQFDCGCTHLSALGNEHGKPYLYQPDGKYYLENHWIKEASQLQYLANMKEIMPPNFTWPEINTLELEATVDNQLHKFKPFAEKIINN